MPFQIQQNRLCNLKMLPVLAFAVLAILSSETVSHPYPPFGYQGSPYHGYPHRHHGDFYGNSGDYEDGDVGGFHNFGGSNTQPPIRNFNHGEFEKNKPGYPAHHSGGDKFETFGPHSPHTFGSSDFSHPHHHHGDSWGSPHGNFGPQYNDKHPWMSTGHPFGYPGNWPPRKNVGGSSSEEGDSGEFGSFGSVRPMNSGGYQPWNFGGNRPGSSQGTQPGAFGVGSSVNSAGSANSNPQNTGGISTNSPPKPDQNGNFGGTGVGGKGPAVNGGQSGGGQTGPISFGSSSDTEDDDTQAGIGTGQTGTGVFQGGQSGDNFGTQGTNLPGSSSVGSNRPLSSSGQSGSSKTNQFGGSQSGVGQNDPSRNIGSVGGGIPGVVLTSSPGNSGGDQVVEIPNSGKPGVWVGSGGSGGPPFGTFGQTSTSTQSSNEGTIGNDVFGNDNDDKLMRGPSGNTGTGPSTSFGGSQSTSSPNSNVDGNDGGSKSNRDLSLNVDEIFDSSGSSMDQNDGSDSVSEVPKKFRGGTSGIFELRGAGTLRNNAAVDTERTPFVSSSGRPA